MVNAAIPIITHASVRSRIGIGGNMSITVALGATWAAAISTPKIPADAPTSGV